MSNKKDGRKKLPNEIYDGLFDEDPNPKGLEKTDTENKNILSKDLQSIFDESDDSSQPDMFL